jgi:hypothetical protein
MRRAWPILPLLLTDCAGVDPADLDKAPAWARREVPGEYRAVAACVADDLIRATGRRFDYSVSDRPDRGEVTIRARAWDLWGLTTVQWRREVAFAPAGTGTRVVYRALPGTFENDGVAELDDALARCSGATASTSR